MASYAVGDIHGCMRSFQRLLEKIEFNKEMDTIWHTGDLVNGGPDSLGVIRWFKEHEYAAQTVLGNHDLHLIAVAYTGRKRRAEDTLEDILQAPDREELLSWLTAQPLLVRRGRRVLVHAGLLPEWTVEMAEEAAREVEGVLQSSQRDDLLKSMYGNEPRTWSGADTKLKRWRITINALTRMRVIDQSGELDFNYKGSYDSIPRDKYAWFDAKAPGWKGHQVVCGHWSALGLYKSRRILGLDTGCRWGRRLTACRLEDETIFQVDAVE